MADNDAPFWKVPEPVRSFATGGVVRQVAGLDDDCVPFPIGRCPNEQAGLAAVRRAPAVEQAIADATPQPNPWLIGDRYTDLMHHGDSPAHDGVQSFMAELARRTPLGGRVEFEIIGNPATSNRMRATVVPPEPPTYDELVDTLARLVPPRRPSEPIKLTREQADQLPKTPPHTPGQPDPALFGTRVEIVADVRDSSPWQWLLDRLRWRR